MNPMKEFAPALLLLFSSCENPEPPKTDRKPVTNHDATALRKYYLITASPSGRRYTVWNYELLAAGTVRFQTIGQGGRTVVLSPPYEIEERTAARGW